MKSGLFLFLGLFVALTLSWGGLVLGSHRQLGALTPYYDDAESASFPSRTSGIAARGQMVYADLGCAACHTQQVRRPDFGSDQARGWGERQSVARDYIFQARPQLGASRFGPDLTNLAGRKPSAMDSEDLMKLLYLGSGTHPSYKFLFDDLQIVGQPANGALRLKGNAAAVPGHEIVPTERARSLVAYLLSLNNAYDYPESRPMAAAAAEGHGAKPGEKAAPTKQDGKAAPAKQDEKAAPAKKEEGKK
jgi:cytochrome c oxidase cbb3-type subunit 2